jgi:hypothetical protein
MHIFYIVKGTKGSKNLILGMIDIDQAPHQDRQTQTALLYAQKKKSTLIKNKNHQINASRTS